MVGRQEAVGVRHPELCVECVPSAGSQFAQMLPADSCSSQRDSPLVRSRPTPHLSRPPAPRGAGRPLVARLGTAPVATQAASPAPKRQPRTVG